MAYKVSDAYLEYINGKKKLRQFKGRLEIYFDGLDKPSKSFTDEDFYEIDFIADSSVASNMPFGQIALKTITITFDNTDRYFTVTNKQSPYYGKLLAGVPVDVFLSTLIDPVNDIFEEIPLGRIYAGDWNVSSNAATATLTGYDKLYTYYKVATPKIGVIQNTTIGDLFKLLLLTVGFIESDIIIDEDVYKVTVPFGWIPGTTIKESLTALCVAGACNISMTRTNKVFVASAYSNRIATRRLRNSEQLINVEQPQSLYNAYKGVSVQYFTTSISNVEDSLVTSSDMTLKEGVNNITDLVFTNSPVYKVSSCILTDNLNHSIVPSKIGATSIDATITAITTTTADLEVKGYVLKQSAQTVTVDRTSDITTLQDSRLTISSPLIQSADIAEDYANILVAVATDPSIYLTAEMRGDPSIDPLDKVYMHPDSKSTELIPIIVTRLAFTYSGGLTGTLEGTKADALEKYAYVYMGPGFYSEYLKHK